MELQCAGAAIINSQALAGLGKRLVFVSVDPIEPSTSLPDLNSLLAGLYAQACTHARARAPMCARTRTHTVLALPLL